MKVTYTEIIENHFTLNWHKFCPKCGAHEYEIVEQSWPYTEYKWYIQCPQCDYSIGPYLTRQGAMEAWKRC